MKPNLYLRASVALVATCLLGAGAVAAGAQTLGRSEAIASVEPADARTPSDPSSTGEGDEAADAGTSAEHAAEQAAVLQAEADRAAAELAYFERLEEEAAYFDKLEEQAFFAALERQAALDAAAAARPAGVPDDSYWDRMAACETGGNWSMTGSRFSGGVGFANTTWDAWGGREFAPLAGQATRDQQIVVANRVATQGYGNVAPVGYSGWGCAKHSVGYP